MSSDVRSCPQIARHSSLSSGLTTPSSDVVRALRRRSSMPADFCCSICMNIFRKVVLYMLLNFSPPGFFSFYASILCRCHYS
ncbi:hypothetical protein GCK32_012269 [Trichostrongylus colubriformis]|uniref:Uncharacterized protein n=1 Tax=Trichostrongylus colubriformis TaxID=6319 RepID=A0AAN8IPX7_TRICO